LIFQRIALNFIFSYKQMISPTELIQQLKNTMGKFKVLELTKILREQDFALRDLIDITFAADRDIAFRAAWILETIVLQDASRYENDLEYLLSRIKEVKHASCQRHYAKICMHITAKKAPVSINQLLQKIDLEPVVEQCFDWLIDPEILVAVKVFSSEALFNMRNRFPWIKDELANQIQFSMKNGTAAIQSRGRKLLGLLSPHLNPLQRRVL
jgi:hypothetical protein